MKTHDTRPKLSRLVFATLALLLPPALCGHAPGGASASGYGQDVSRETPESVAKRMTSVEGIEKEFGDEDLKAMERKPRGKGGYGLLFDTGQLNDPSVPVALGGIQSLSGGGKYSGVTKIKRVGLRNRSPKIVNSVELGWSITARDDPEEVLAEGAFPFANVWVKAGGYEIIEVPTIYPTLLLNAVAKDGVVSGSFMITIGVREARFADGSLWRRQ